MDRRDIRNVAIIAHVDHGKTTLVDQLLRQSGQFRPGELTGDCILDSNPLERERGITILSKNCAIQYTSREGHEYHVNIVDTPGHADFGGEVQRVLKMADGVLLIVDAADGPMPQTRYVLGKALEEGLLPIVVINKMDRSGARPHQVHDEVLDLLIDLGADEKTLDCPVVYASGRDGWAVDDMEGLAFAADGSAIHAGGDVHAIFDAIIRHVPVPDLDADAPVQMLVTSIDYSDYVGRIGVGRVFAGTLRPGPVMTFDRHGNRKLQKIAQLYQFDGLGRREVDRIDTGDLCAVVGLEQVDIGDTLADAERPAALEPVHVDEPTLHMTFRINDGPFAGREGKYVTSRHLKDRLDRELQSNVALRVKPGAGDEEFEVSGRGLLHLGILLENMRREGFELCVGKPRVVMHHQGHKVTEPIERLVVDVPGEFVGAAMGLLGDRRAELIRMDTRPTRTVMEFTVPARGLIGLRNRMLTATQGEAIMHHTFEGYGEFRGPIGGRSTGVMIATDTGAVTAYALDQLADRGIMLVTPGQQIYEGQVVGQTNREDDIPVNVTRTKKLTNMRASSKDATVTLKAARRLSLEEALEFIENDELVELTPTDVRIRKRLLTENERKRHNRRAAAAAE